MDNPTIIAATLLSPVAFFWGWAICIRRFNIGMRETFLFITWCAVAGLSYAFFRPVP
jgi:hypothetical protein